MNFSDIRYFIENQLRSAEQRPDSPEAGDAMLMMADYLLEQVQTQPDAFTQTSGRELRRKFLRCGSIARRVGSFADLYGESISQEAASSIAAIAENAQKIQKIQQDCETIEENLPVLQEQETDLKNKIQQLEQENAALLEQESALLERKKETDLLYARIQECQHILTEITDQKLQEMRTELMEIEPDAVGLKSQYDDLLQKLHEAQDRIDTVQSETEAIQNQVNLLLKEQIPEAEEQLANIRKQKNSAEQTYSGLLSAINEAGKDYEELQALLEENRKIAERILESGFVLDDKNSPDSFYVQIQTVTQQANEITEKYNRLLQNVLTDARTLYQKILDRQEPNYKP